MAATLREPAISLLNKMLFPLPHSQSVESALLKMTPRAAFSFGAAICQRAWPIFSKGLKRHKNANANELATSMSAIWQSLAGLRASPSPIATAFGNAIPTAETMGYDSEFFDSATLLYGFAECFDRSSTEGLILISDAAIALLDSFLYDSLDIDVNAANDAIVSEHPLMQREMKRQNADLLALHNGADRNAVLLLWERSRGESLLDET